MADSTIPTPAPLPSAPGPRRIPLDTLDLGDRVIVYYSDGTTEVLEKGRLGGSGGGDGGLTQNTVYTQSQQNAREAASLAEQQRQFNEQFGYNKARGDQQQQLSEGQALGYFRGAPTLARDQFSEGQRQFNTRTAIDYYTELANKLANPRNFIESAFRLRGAPVPAGVQDFSNVNQYMRAQPYAGAAPASFPQAPAPQQQPQTTAAYNPASDPNRGTRFEGLSGFNTDGTLRLAPNDPDAEKLMAKYPGRYRVGFGSGGVIPEPVMGMGMMSGQRYMFGEQGPEGVVPANLLPRFLQQRHGQMMGGGKGYAVGGIIGADFGAGAISNDYLGPGLTPDPYLDLAPAPPPSPYDSPALTAGSDPGAATFTAPTYDMAALQAQAAQLAAQADTQNALQRATTTTATQPPTTQPVTTQPTTTQPPQRITGGGWLPPAILYGTETPNIAAPQPPTVTPPLQLPQGSTPQPVTPPATGAVMPRDVSVPGTFGNRIGNMPSFLPGEDQAQGTLGYLLSQGILPPFLSRILGQNRGVHSQGTNQPQQFNLPSDVPVVSRLAASQMSPSERAAFESYISSYGIAPEDYWAYVDQLSPHGAVAQQPLFGNYIPSFRQ